VESETETLPPAFSHVRILKKLRPLILQLRILKELQADDFGQNPKKRGVGL
jgi:hypothetical protein